MGSIPRWAFDSQSAPSRTQETNCSRALKAIENLHSKCKRNEICETDGLRLMRTRVRHQPNADLLITKNKQPAENLPQPEKLQKKQR